MFQYCKVFFVCVCLQLLVHNADTATVDSDWWKHTVVYELYARSFKDANNDGNGDIPGMIEKIPTLAKFGIGAIWITPIQKTPMVDAGYDISNYKEIDPMYGTLSDFKNLVKTAHDHGLKIILDFVPNHSSDKHEWFKASCNGTAKYKDYYVWRAKKNGGVPNNWQTVFGTPAWTWNEARQMYYLHQFVKSMPDLNYRNEKVFEAMADVLTYWMDLGVDGFRMDAAPYLVEDAEFRDNPSGSHKHTQHLPETYEVFYKFRAHLDAYSKAKGGAEKILMTEAYGSTAQEQLYYGTKDGSKKGAHFSFNFKFIFAKNAADVVSVAKDWLNNLPSIYTHNWLLGNHDQTRAASRVGKNNIDGFNMLMAIMPGVGVTFNGEEIGMEDGPGLGSSNAERNPYQWDDSTNAGFNTGKKPWLPVNSDYKTVNLKTEMGKEKSHFKIYQKMLTEIRPLHPVHSGKTEIEAATDDTIFVKRQSSQGTVLLLFNLGHNSKTETINATKWSDCTSAKVLLTSGNSKHTIGNSVTLKTVSMAPHEAIVLSC